MVLALPYRGLARILRRCRRRNVQSADVAADVWYAGEREPHEAGELPQCARGAAAVLRRRRQSASYGFERLRRPPGDAHDIVGRCANGEGATPVFLDVVVQATQERQWFPVEVSRFLK